MKKNRMAKTPLSFRVKLILFLLLCWIIVPCAINGIVILQLYYSSDKIISTIEFLLTSFIFFFLINFPCKTYSKIQKTICVFIAVIDALAWYFIFMLAMSV